MDSKIGEDLIEKLPYGPGFLFVDGIDLIRDDQIQGHYHFKPNWSIFDDHFPELPVVPGVILTECAAQITLAIHGLYLWQTEGNKSEGQFALAEVQMNYFKPVYPNDIVIVRGSPVYFRFNKLKTRVQLSKNDGERVAEGLISGMLTANNWSKS